MAEIQLGLQRIHDLGKDALEQFACTREELKAFLVEEALEYARYGLTETAVAFVNDDPIPAGYFSLSADGLKLQTSEKFELGLPFECPIEYFPAVKITKLAVRTDLQRKGLGRAFLDLIEGIAFESGFSVRLLTVDAVNEPHVIAFYQSLGFQNAMRNGIRQAQRQRQGRGGANDRPETVLMYKDIYNDDAPVTLTSPVPTTEPPQIS